MLWSLRLASLSLLVPALASAQTTSAAGLDIRLGIGVPLRDNVRLNATLYVPRWPAEPRPVILAMTPYSGDRYHEYVLAAARRGYVVAVVDVRGRGSSEGMFDPFAQEATDGYDTVEWIAGQPWCNGKVGMMGGSYGGFNQWAIAKEFPPHLTTIAPTAAPYMGVDWPAFGGIWPSYMMQWVSFTSGHALNANLFADGGYWRDKFRDLYVKHLPFASLDSVVGNPSSAFQQWIAHPDFDEYWAAMAPSPEQLARLTLPIFTRTGMYDNAQIGALEHYRNHMRYGSASAKAAHYLMIGPWDHGGTRVPQRRLGDLTFGPTSVFDMGELESDWYDWTMRGGNRPSLLPKRVAYYVTGADVWKYADSLDEIGRNPTRYFLTSTGQSADDVVHSGGLVPSEPNSAPPDEWTHDPLDTGPGAREAASPGSADQSSATVSGHRGLIYHTAPFDHSVEISGIPTLTLWLTFDVRDADLWAGIFEITRDGKSILLDDTQLRARYRSSRRSPELLVPGQPTRIELDRFRFMSRRVATGSRVRLVIMSPSSIQLETNYNAGGVVATETAKDAHTAHIKLHHESGRSSILRLPVVPPGQGLGAGSTP